MKTILSCAVGCFLLAAIPAFGEVDMQEGNWETTMQIFLEGSTLPMPPSIVTATQCLAKKDLVPSPSDRDENCTVTDRKVTGNTVTWKVRCEDGQGRTEREGSITYAGSSYQGVVRTAVLPQGSDETARSTVTMRGKRLGACDK